MSATVEPLLRQLHRLMSRREADVLGDGVLLERFLASRDESAFAPLLARHGPMVLGVCRRVLHDVHDAEDVFQAVFLVLARKADSLRRPQSLAAWLYGTARHLALKVRRDDARRRQREVDRLQTNTPSTDPLDQLAARELLLVLDEEMDRLPETQRLPLLLCGLEGRSHEEAARLLGWSVGSLKGRLERGRRRLHARLVRRGLAFTGALLTLEISQGGTASAAARLTAATLPAALAFSQGEGSAISGEVAALAESAMANVTAAKVKIGLALLLAASLAAGTGALAHQTLVTQPPQTQADEREKPQSQRADRPAPSPEKRSGVDLYGDPLPPGAIARMGTMRFRHFDTVISVAYSPDGKLIASGQSNQGPIVLWDAATGRELRRLEEEPGVLGGFAFSPDSKQLALVKWGSWVGLWDVATGKQIRRLKVQPGGCVTYSPDGKMMAVPYGNNVILLDAISGKELRRLQGHPETIRSLTFSPDGKTVAAGGDGKSVGLWDVETGKQLHILRGHQKPVPSVAFSADGKTLASASHDRTVRLWNVATGQEQRQFTHKERDDDAIQTVHFVPKRPWLITGSLRSIRVWDLSTGKEVRRLPGHFCLSGCPVALSPDGTRLATRGGEQGQIILWELATGKRLCPPGGHQRPIGSVAFSPDGKTLATGSWDETLRLWDAKSGKELRRVSLAFDVRLVFTPDGETLAGSSADGFIRFWDAAAGKERRRFLTHKHGVSSFAVAPDGKTFVSTAMNWVELAADGKTMVPKYPPDKAIHLWRVDTGAEIRRFEGHQEVPSRVAFAPDGRTVVSVSQDKTARLWDVASAKEMRQFRGHQGYLGCIVYSPDGKTAAGAGQDKIIHLWDVASGEEVRRFVGHQDSIGVVRFSADGRMLASASHDRTVRLWEVATGQERHRFEGHRHSVFALDFSRDGRRLASAGYDATALIWDVLGTLGSDREQAAPLAEKELVRHWTELGEEKDAARAYQAMSRLLRDPAGTMRFIREELRPVPATDGARIAQWIADLDSAEFAVREKAMRELTQRGETVEVALRKVLKDRPSLEVRQRIKLLLDKLQGAHRLRTLRAVEVLEHLGTPDARRLLEALAEGAPEARLTQEAKASLGRLTARPANHP